MMTFREIDHRSLGAWRFITMPIAYAALAVAYLPFKAWRFVAPTEHERRARAEAKRDMLRALTYGDLVGAPGDKLRRQIRRLEGPSRREQFGRWCAEQSARLPSAHEGH